MENSARLYKALKVAVERAVGRKMCSPRDFNYLVISIHESTQELLSATTLKRFWGYIDNGKDYKPFRHTLDVLSLYVGYKDWDTFCSQSSANEKVNSDYLNNNRLYTSSLNKDGIVVLLWEPDRKVIIKYLGLDLFEVAESINSKLEVGDKFICGHFIDNEPLYLTRLIRGNEILGDYVCGRGTGIKFKTIESKIKI